MGFIVTMLIVIAIVVFDYVPIIRNGNKLEYISYGIIFAVSFVLLVLISFEFDIPSLWLR